MTFVRGNKKRIERTTVISESEFKDALAKAETLNSKYFRLRAKAALSLFRLTGKRRGEIEQIPLANFVKKGTYIHRLEFKDPQNYDVATATTIEEIKHLAQAGFQKFDEVNGIHIYRRPKKYNS